MSEALRAMMEASDSDTGFEPESPLQDQTSDQDAPQVDVDEPQAVADEPQQQQDPRQQQQRRQLSKFELAKRKVATEDRRSQKQTEAAQAEQQARAQLEQRAAQAEAELKRRDEQARIDADPFLKEAVALLGKNLRPEDVEAEANRLDARGDEEGARGARMIAIQMRNHLQQNAEAQQNAQAEAAQTQWRNYAFGTPEFDQAAGFVRHGTQEFDDCWGTCEENLIERLKESQDPLDQELGKDFRNKNGTFGKRMVWFLHNTPFGKAFSKHALGILPSYELVKASIAVERYQHEIQQLKAEVAKLRGLTSFAGSAPVGYTANGSRSHMSENLSMDEFERLSLDQMRERIRANERN